MINLRITDNIKDIRAWTGLPADSHDMELWEAGFDLDDWDICIESDQRLLQEFVDKDGDRSTVPVDEAWWLVRQMESYCVGYNEVEYNGKWYYTVHHA